MLQKVNIALILPFSFTSNVQKKSKEILTAKRTCNYIFRPITKILLILQSLNVISREEQTPSFRPADQEIGRTAPMRAVVRPKAYGERFQLSVILNLLTA